MFLKIDILLSIVTLSLQCGTNDEIDWRKKGAVLPVPNQVDMITMLLMLL